MELSKMDEPQKKERKSLGVLFPNVNKDNPKSYDLKGTVTTPDGIKYRVGGYKANATGAGKLPKDSVYYWVHRCEPLETNEAGAAFDPAQLET